MLISGSNPFVLAKEKKRPLILDGATGSLLQKKGFKSDSYIWMTNLNRTFPNVILEIHKSYMQAGADIITTNTFRTNLIALESVGISDNAPYVKEAVLLAKESAESLAVFIAGSNAPAEDCYQKERKISYNKLEINHKNHIDLLLDNDVHFILNETQSHFDEIEIICEHCSQNKIPFVISLFLDSDLRILSRERTEDVIKFILDHVPLAIGFNCIAPALFRKLISNIKLNTPWGYYLNCGSEHFTNKKMECSVLPEDYLDTVKDFVAYNPSFIGACCGSNPDHIKKIKDYFDGKAN